MKAARCKAEVWTSSKVASFLLRRPSFTKAAAQGWLKAHGKVYAAIEALPNWWRAPQVPKSACDCYRMGPLIKDGTMRLLFCGKLKRRLPR